MCDARRRTAHARPPLRRRLSRVCRRFKKSTYNLDVIVRCVESGGVTDANRGEKDKEEKKMEGTGE